MSIVESIRTAVRRTGRNVRPGRTPNQPRGRFDLCLRDPVARRLRSGLEQGDWQAVHKFLDGTLDWEERDFYVSALCEWQGRPEWLDEWTRFEPGSSLGWLMSGAHGVRWAWQARGSSVASNVTNDDTLLFIERLETAEEDLHRAISVNAADPTPWVFLLTTGRGLGVETDEHERRFAEVIERSPLHRHGHSMSLQHRCEKWYGSHDAMFDFVRETSAAAPDGTNLHGLVAEAHIERWLLIDSEEASSSYWQDPAIREEISAAARRSVLAPGYASGRGSIYEHNLFAFCAAQLGDRDAARIHFEGCHGLVTKYPWAYLGNGDPTTSFNATQQALLG